MKKRDLLPRGRSLCYSWSRKSYLEDGRGGNMTDRDIMHEIDDLRKQLQSLTAAQRQAVSEDIEGGSGERSQAQIGEGAGTWFHDLVKQAEELLGGLDLQFKDVPAKTALVIFALGILTGRLLSGRR
jgi:hypothetical protein